VVRAEDAAEADSPLKPCVGQPRFSLANWLALHQPLLVVDEAHNTKTDRSFEAPAAEPRPQYWNSRPRRSP
jgi:type III restriction enzyme